MVYLPITLALLLSGGRNDELCAQQTTPFLNDIYLFLLDQKAWLKVKFTSGSDSFEYIGNHMMSCVSDSDSYERVMIFGGITNQVHTSRSGKKEVSSKLNSAAFLLNVI